MISSLRIIGFPAASLADLMANRKGLEEVLQGFLSRVKSDPSLSAQQDAEEIRTNVSFPIYYLNSVTLGQRVSLVVEIHVASCIITKSRYWAAELTAVLRKFFVSAIPQSIVSASSVRYEVIEVAFIDS